ncbi:MAG: lipocalin-like domain-containing protein [Ginsengibacter sp.]|jgi:predicted secreted hydrolase
MKKWLFIFLLVIFSSQYAHSQDWKSFPYTPPGSKISFPKDEGRHGKEPIEWWYISGHLKGKTSGKSYSIMLTYFFYPASTFEGFRILTLMDNATGAFYKDTRPVNYTQLSTTQLDIQTSVYNGGKESWVNLTKDNKLIPFEYSIKANDAKVELDLISTATRRPLILDDDGYLEQGLSNYTYYYSLTRNKVTGKLILNGMMEEVEGESWIDRQYGNFNPLTGEKYEWFHVQLSNGMDLNLWNIFTAENKIPDKKEYRIQVVYVNETTQYTTSDFTIERLGFNFMPDSIRCYASKWRLKSSKNNLDLIITTKHPNTEVEWPFRFYEGATDITGTVNGNSVTGFGFAELLHHYEKPVVEIKEPQKEIYDISKPITWQLLNPDEGRQITYNLEYSVDEKVSFQPVVKGITDTTYQWINPPLAEAQKIWFKITGMSIDNKLTGSVISQNSLKVLSRKSGAGQIKLYPNPVTDILRIEPAFQMDNPTARILNSGGGFVQELNKNSLGNFIDVSNLPRGVYFLEIDFSNGKKVLKFVKK